MTSMARFDRILRVHVHGCHVWTAGHAQDTWRRHARTVAGQTCDLVRSRTAGENALARTKHASAGGQADGRLGSRVLLS
jgi:hypothetical protein